MLRPNLDAIRELFPAPGDTIVTLGHTTPHDGGAGAFVCLQRSPDADPDTLFDNNGTLIRTLDPLRAWVRIQNGEAVTPQMFGARPFAVSALNGKMEEGVPELRTSHAFGMRDPTGERVVVLGGGPEGGLFQSWVTGQNGALLQLEDAPLSSVGNAQFVLGFDCADAIQAAIDWSVYGTWQTRLAGLPLLEGCKSSGECFIPAGHYLVGREVWLGYGTYDGYYEGASVRGAHAGEGGTILYPTFTDRGVLCLQGLRNPLVERLRFVGLGLEHAQRNQPLPNLQDPYSLEGWADPRWPNNPFSRHSPHAAIVVDPCCGTAPEDSYPPPTYPAWVTDPRHYGRGQSSAVAIRDCKFEGFPVGVVNQPCAYDGNADFTTLEKCTFHFCALPISVGNSQSRNVRVQDCTFNQGLTAITTTLFGACNGQIRGVVENCSFGHMHNLLDCPNSRVAGPLQVVSAYSEYCWRIGRWGRGVAPSASLAFKGGVLSFGMQSLERGIPTTLLDAGYLSRVSFEGTDFHGYCNVAVFGGHAPSYRFDDVSFQPQGDPDADPLWSTNAQAFLASMMLEVSSGHESRPQPGKIYFLYLRDPDGGRLPPTQQGGAEVIWASPRTPQAARRCISAWAHSVAPSQNMDAVLPLPHKWAATAKREATLAGREFSFELSWAQNPAQAQRMGPQPGDVVFDARTKSVLFTSDRQENTIFTQLQNGFRCVGGIYEYASPPTQDDNPIYIGNARLFSLPYDTLARVDKGSPFLKDFKNQVGVTSPQRTLLRPGDLVLEATTEDFHVFPYGQSEVAAVPSDGDLELRDPARRSGTVRLGLFIRKE